MSDDRPSTNAHGVAKKQKRSRHRNQIQKPEEDSQQQESAVLHSEQPLTKYEREALRRRSRREKEKERKMQCFLCRQRGHSVRTCPRNNGSKESNGMVSGSGTGMCFRCGSMEHSLSKCPKPVDKENPTPFATCFICKQSGHLVGQCPKNERGLYPKGGGCLHCGSVRHFAKDCTENRRRKFDEPVIGTMDAHQGGDDDDEFLAIQKEFKDSKHHGTTTSSAHQSNRGMQPKKPQHKVIRF